MEQKRTGLSLAAALIAALIGGIVWAAIGIITDYELGLIAWLIGGLTGYAVIKAAKDQVSVVDQLFAVVASLLGILVGKYLFISYLINDGIAGMFDGASFAIFQDVFVETLSKTDIIFVFFAVYTAWKIPGQAIKAIKERSSEPQVQPPAEPPASGASF
jgi:hypothetical protein